MEKARLSAKLGAEFLGMSGLVFGGCGAAVLAAEFLSPDQVQLGIGFVGVALAFGLSVLTGACASATSPAATSDRVRASGLGCPGPAAAQRYTDE